jgi:hypothetical protein
MKVYELSGETRYRAYSKYFFNAISTKDAIFQFKAKIGIGRKLKKIKAIKITWKE